MGRVHKRYSDGLVWESDLTPAALKKLKINRQMSQRCSLVPAGHMEFLVNDNGKKLTVDLKEKTCICKYWEMTGLISCLPSNAFFLFFRQFFDWNC
jgi:hypothetical protein